MVQPLGQQLLPQAGTGDRTRRYRRATPETHVAVDPAVDEVATYRSVRP
ncbi:hypothetical protein ACH49A_15875 [Micromonospora sediminicola]